MYGYRWWLSHPSEKYEFINWDDYSQYMGKENMFQTTNQSYSHIVLYQYLDIYTHSIQTYMTQVCFCCNKGPWNLIEFSGIEHHKKQ